MASVIPVRLGSAIGTRQLGHCTEGFAGNVLEGNRCEFSCESPATGAPRCAEDHARPDVTGALDCEGRQGWRTMVFCHHLWLVYVHVLLTSCLMVEAGSRAIVVSEPLS